MGKHKKLLVGILAGYVIAFFFPPTRIVGKLGGGSSTGA